MRRTAALVTALIATLAAFLVQPTSAAAALSCPFNCVVHNARWAIASQSYYHYGNPLLGRVRSDTWVDEQYETSDIGTEPYLFWRVRAESRVVKVYRALRVQVEVTRLEDVHGNVLARNASPVNSGTASYALQVSPWADVQPLEYCLDSTTLSPLRVRTLFTIRWLDGTLSRVSRLGPWTNANGGPEWCYP